jgi:capsular polysaccharide transport system permease protein
MTGTGAARTAYLVVRDGPRGFAALRFLRSATGRLSLGRIAAALAVILVLAPLCAACTYFGLLASPRYVSDARLAVRAPSVAPDALGLGKIASALPQAAHKAGSAQDPFIVASFLVSPELVRSLDRDGWLRSFYSGSEIDPLSRLPRDASLEALYRHWRRHVSAAVDRRSNAILFEVAAYRPEHAQVIADAALEEAGRMLERLVERQTQDTLAIARAELMKAEARHAAASQALEQFRRTSAIVDPVADVADRTQTLLGLIRTRMEIEAQLSAREALGGSEGPPAGELRAQRDAIAGEIERLRDDLLGVDRSEGTLAAVAAAEAIELERQFARAMLDIAGSSLDRARLEAERSASSLLVYLEPTLPEEAREPRTAVMIAFVLAICFVAWLFATTVIAVLLDQME